MKRFIIASILLAGFFSMQAQDMASPTISYSALEKKLKKSDEAINDAKDKVKASTWFDSQGLIEEALGYALTGEDVEGAARIVEDCRHDLLNREDWISLDRYLNQLPEEVVWERPALILARAWVLDFRVCHFCHF